MFFSPFLPRLASKFAKFSDMTFKIYFATVKFRYQIAEFKADFDSKKINALCRYEKRQNLVTLVLDVNDVFVRTLIFLKDSNSLFVDTHIQYL